MPELRNDLNQPESIDRQMRLVRLLKLGGIGETLAGKISASKLKARSQAFRGNGADHAGVKSESSVDIKVIASSDL